MHRAPRRARRGLVTAAAAAVAVAVAVLAALAAGWDLPKTRATAAEAPRSDAPVARVEDRPVVTFVGDSWTQGDGSPTWRGYAVLTGEMLDAVHPVMGVGGSGYVVPGSGRPFADRIDAALDTDPDVLVIQGSINDQAVSPEQLEPAVLATLTRLRAEAGPDTRVLVLGASHVPGLPRDVVERINGVLARTAAGLGLRFVDPAAENWTDPADPTIWADDIHPNDAGYQRIADRLTPLVRELLEG